LFGYVPEPRRFEFGVMNLPRFMFLFPEHWYALFHEVGHEAYSLTINSLTKKDRAKLYKRMIDPRVKDKKIQHKIFWEIFSDMFDFRFGFGGNWETYLKALWTYLLQNSKELKNIDMDLLQRTFSLYISIGPSRLPPEKMQDADLRKIASKFMNDFVEALEFEVVTIDINLTASELANGAGFLIKGLNELVTLLDSCEAPRTDIDVSHCLQNGIVPDNSDPSQVIRALAKMWLLQKCGFKERFTAIACLLDYSIKHVDY
jgi:hypothetical protein